MVFLALYDLEIFWLCPAMISCTDSERHKAYLSNHKHISFLKGISITYPVRFPTDLDEDDYDEDNDDDDNDEDNRVMMTVITVLRVLILW